MSYIEILAAIYNNKNYCNMEVLHGYISIHSPPASTVQLTSKATLTLALASTILIMVNAYRI